MTMTKQFNEENIRVAAYFLWENAGRPEGMEKEFWNQACNQFMNLKSCSKKVNNKNCSKSVALKSSTKKTTTKASGLKVTSIKPTVIAKPFYGIKK